MAQQLTVEYLIEQNILQLENKTLNTKADAEMQLRKDGYLLYIVNDEYILQATGVQGEFLPAEMVVNKIMRIDTTEPDESRSEKWSIDVEGLTNTPLHHVPPKTPIWFTLYKRVQV